MPPPELAEQGVYCDDCHVIEADWQRSKQEVTPPNCSVEAVWQVRDFGGIEAEVANVKQVSAAPATLGGNARGNSGGNGARNSKAVPKHAPKGSVKQQPATEDSGPRVPFGRGPKDKSLRTAPERKQGRH